MLIIKAFINVICETEKFHIGTKYIVVPDKGVDSARKLLYVICSRAKNSLFLFSEIGYITSKGTPLSSTQLLNEIEFDYDFWNITIQTRLYVANRRSEMSVYFFIQYWKDVKLWKQKKKKIKVAPHRVELKFVIPNMEKTFGNLEFAGEDKVVRGESTDN